MTGIYGGRIVRNILCHDGSGSDSDLASNLHTWQKCDASTDPHIVPDDYRFRPFLPAIPFLRICAVTRRVNTHVRADKTIISDIRSFNIANFEAESEGASALYL